MRLSIPLNSKKYDLLEWITLFIVLSYLLIPYFPKYSLQIFGKTFFLSQVLMLIGLIIIPWMAFYSSALRDRLRALFNARSVVWLLILCMTIIMISTVINHGLTQVVITRLLSILAVLTVTLLLSLFTGKFIDRFMVMGAWFTIVASILGYLQFFKGSAFAPALYLSGRSEVFAVGFAKHSSLFGLHLSAFLILFWVLLILKYQNRSWLWGTTFFIGVPALVLTFSRGAWLAVALVGSLALFQLLKEYREKIYTIIYTLLTAIVLAILTLVTAFYFGPAQMYKTIDIDRYDARDRITSRFALTDASSMSRVYFHQAAFVMLRDNPLNLLIGLGAWGFWDNWPEFAPENTTKRRIDPHSTFLEVLISGGVTAFILFVGFLWYLLKQTIRYRNEHILIMPLTYTSAVVLAGGLMHTHFYSKYTWIFIGITLALLAIAKDNKHI